jgi:hypothetical protein
LRHAWICEKGNIRMVLVPKNSNKLEIKIAGMED